MTQPFPPSVKTSMWIRLSDSCHVQNRSFLNIVTDMITAPPWTVESRGMENGSTKWVENEWKNEARKFCGRRCLLEAVLTSS